MANTNQGTRAGQVFGRLIGDGFAGNDWENVVLKPGYIIKIRDRFALVEAVEGLSIDLYFNDSITVTGDGSNRGLDNTATDESDKVSAYGEHTMNALLGIGTSTHKQRQEPRFYLQTMTVATPSSRTWNPSRDTCTTCAHHCRHNQSTFLKKETS